MIVGDKQPISYGAQVAWKCLFTPTLGGFDL